MGFCRRILFYALSLLLSLVLLDSLTYAYPTFAVGELNYAYFNNREVWQDKDQDGEISTGDVFWGILHVQNIEDSQRHTKWNEDNVPPDIDTFTGYFYTEVIDIVPGTPNPYIIFGVPSQSDPNGIISDTELNAGVVLKLFTDTSTPFINDVTQVASATDGAFWASFGLDTVNYWDEVGDSWTGSTYWYSQAPVNPPTSGKVGNSWFGLKVIDNASGLPFKDINDPTEIFADKDVSLFGESEITVADYLTTLEQSAGYTQDQIFESDDPVNIFPTPEPATMLLTGSGLLLMNFILRRKIKRK